MGRERGRGIKMEESYSPDGMLDSYLYECFQLLEQMEAIALSEESGDFFRAEDLDEIFRILHTIKGSSGIMMYDSIGMTAHKLEDIFYYLRETSVEEFPKEGLSDCIFMAANFMTEELNKIKEGKIPDGDSGQVFDKVDACLGVIKDAMRQRGMELPPERTYTEPGMYYNAPANARKKKKTVKIDLGMEPEEKSGVQPGDYVILDRKWKQKDKSALVGIRMGKLEEVTALSKELVQLDRDAQELEKGEIIKRLHQTAEELRASVGDMMKTPVVTVFRRMQLIIQDTSRRLNKDIECRMTGEQLLVDRLLAEKLTEPLMHIVRNAADHGIESGKERRNMGKPLTGIISLSAWKEGELLCLSVRNDGRELDARQIFERAKEKGFLDGAAEMGDYSQEEIFKMITQAGFSTMDKVTEISGRGIGMDIVAERLKELGGRLRIRNIPGEGVEMVMEIPLD